MFSDVYRGSHVLVLGHTGFKGSWLCSWLLELGADVTGGSLGIPTKPSLFEVAGLEDRLTHRICDVRDANALDQLVSEVQPDFVFFLAAQAIVSVSYEDPIETIQTNVLGTANILQALRSLKKQCSAVIITSDKCYENVEWAWGYKETDHLGGKDIYSASKGAAEIVFHGFSSSFFEGDYVRLATARAGNVIGGGDWSKDRIVVDCMTRWARNELVEIRSPLATRPWQHVLEPLSGYLMLGAALVGERDLHGEAFNFGPKAEIPITVERLIQDLGKSWGQSSSDRLYNVTDNIPFHEAGLLKLNCDKALFYLGWEANLTYEECVDFVGSWYLEYYKGQRLMEEFTINQIREYQEMATIRELKWTV